MTSLRRCFTFKMQSGVTLVELMIALALGLFLLAGGLLVYSRALRGSADNMSMNHLDTQLRASVQVMARDIRRAGYSGQIEYDVNNYTGSTLKTALSTTLTQNPFRQIRIYNMTTGTLVQPNSLGATSMKGGNCLLFSYDENNDGSVSASEQYGYRLENGALQMRDGGNAFDDSYDDCTTNSSWQPITNKSILVTNSDDYSHNANPIFTEIAQNQEIVNVAGGTSGKCIDDGDQCFQQRQILIDVNGEIARDTSTAESIRQTIKVRNNCYYTYDSTKVNPFCPK